MGKTTTLWFNFLVLDSRRVFHPAPALTVKNTSRIKIFCHHFEKGERRHDV